jgi:hypothetical protein
LFLDTDYEHVTLIFEFIHFPGSPDEILFKAWWRFSMLSKVLQKGGKKSQKAAPAKSQRLYAVIGLGLLFLLCSCTTSNYGKLQSSHEISKMFDNYQILSDHLYYYSGLQGVPDAIIGIHSNYSLDSKAWQQVDLTSLLLKKWAYRMTYVHLVKPRGAWILGPDGHRIGIWYAARHQATVRVEKGNRVVIVPPLPPELRGIP